MSGGPAVGRPQERFPILSRFLILLTLAITLLGSPGSTCSVSGTSGGLWHLSVPESAPSSSSATCPCAPGSSSTPP